MQEQSLKMNLEICYHYNNNQLKVSKMKRLILLAAILITLISCDSSIKKVENPKAETTIEIQNMPSDTMLVAIDKTTLYAINKESKLVEYKVHDGRGLFLVLCITLVAFIGLFIAVFLTD